jgi:hypothetical protein
VPGHLEQLNQRTLLPLEELLTVKDDSPLYNEGDRRSLFYAQSWALTHLLLVAQPSRRDKLAAYVASVDTGIPPMDAWQRAFAADRLDRELQNYVRRSTFSAFRFRFTDKTTLADGSAVPLTADDAEAFLAHFLLQQERYDEAIQRLNRTAPGNAGWPAVVRAGIAVSRKDNAAAEKALLGLQSGSDWLTAYFAGVTLAEMASEGRDAALGHSIRLRAASSTRPRRPGRDSECHCPERRDGIAEHTDATAGDAQGDRARERPGAGPRGLRVPARAGPGADGCVSGGGQGAAVADQDHPASRGP